MLEAAVAATPWVSRYKEEGRFGLPLGSTDPLVRMHRAECVLALHLLIHHPNATIPATIHHAALFPADFIDPDRLEVLEHQAA